MCRCIYNIYIYIHTLHIYNMYIYIYICVCNCDKQRCIRTHMQEQGVVNADLARCTGPGRGGQRAAKRQKQAQAFLAVAVEARKLEHPYPHSLQVKYKESQMGCNWDAVLTQ